MGSLSGDGAAAIAVVLVSWLCFVATGVGAIGANWGTQASHPLPPDTVVRMLKDNGFQKVKLFDAEEGTMNALKKSGLEVMVGIPNDLLSTMATSMKAAEKWVDTNISSYLNHGVSIRGCYSRLRPLQWRRRWAPTHHQTGQQSLQPSAPD